MSSKAASDRLPIGLFDSGVGGLTVLKALQAELPGESYLYLGDTARVPYGTRSPETVSRYAVQATELLIERGIKALVVACNTASAFALEAIRDAHPELPVFGVIQPGAQAAVAASERGHIAVIATEGTVRGGAYQSAIHALAPDTEVSALACPMLVALAEEGWTDGDIVTAILRRYLDPLFAAPAADTLVLGCTHFPVLGDSIRAVVPDNVKLVDSAATTASVVAAALRQRAVEESAGQHFLVTDNVERFRQSALQFLGRELAPESIELVDIR
ncbi:MAG: glutamate racemase [Gammaproteobacteria bacterium]|nr:glutamate racemase [Gammaproteobacteria bacterium]